MILNIWTVAVGIAHVVAEDGNGTMADFKKVGKILRRLHLGTVEPGEVWRATSDLLQARLAMEDLRSKWPRRRSG